MSAQHTPGEWAISRDAVPPGHVQITIYDESTGNRIATVFDRMANAYLIAAAPDLLATLKAFAAIDWTQPQDAPGMMRVLVNGARVAIDKAEQGGNAGCDRCGMIDRVPNSRFCEECKAEVGSDL